MGFRFTTIMRVQNEGEQSIEVGKTKESD